MATQGLSTIGIDVKVNNTSMNYVTEIGDIGGTPATLISLDWKSDIYSLKSRTSLITAPPIPITGCSRHCRRRARR